MRSLHVLTVILVPVVLIFLVFIFLEPRYFGFSIDAEVTSNRSPKDDLKFTIFKPANTTKPAAAPESSCLPADGPVPVILLSAGRSGSTITWQLLQSLTNSTDLLSEEYPGQNPDNIQIELDRVAATKGEWVLKKLCQKIREYPRDYYAGFKWKPYHYNHPSFLQGLDKVAQYPTIKLIRSRRNPIDIALSRIKHGSEMGERGQVDGELTAHCKEGQQDYQACMEQHKRASLGMTVYPGLLLAFLKNFSFAEDSIDQLLKERNVPHIAVSYENLYNHEDATPWNAMLEFLGLENSHVTWEQITGAMTMSDTSHKAHNEAINNFEEVKQAFQGTPYLKLLREG